MLVIFAAFKNEVNGLLKSMSRKKNVKNFKSRIYTGEIFNHEIIVVITGMGKLNAAIGVNDIILMNLTDPVFLIQGISGALVENLKIGDLVIYETIKNIEIPVGDHIRLNSLNDTVCIKQSIKLQANENEFKKEDEDFKNLRLKAVLENKRSGSHTDGFNLEEIKLIKEINNSGPDVQVNIKDNAISDTNINVLKIPGATVPSVVTSYADKITLNKAYGVEAIDMESFYIADAAIKKGIPVICIRSISDNLIESIPGFFAESDRNGIFKRFMFLLKVLFSRSKAKSVLKTIKNINLANKNLNVYILKTVLPFLGYTRQY